MPSGPAVPQVTLLFVSYSLLLFATILGAWIWAIIRLALGLSVVPRLTPRVVPWRGTTVILVVLIWLAVQVFGPAIYLRLRDGGLDGGGPARVKGFQPSDMMIASAIENAALLLILPIVITALSGARPSDFLGAGGTGFRAVRAFQGVAAWPLIAPVVYGMMLLAVAIWGKGTHPLERAIQTEGLGQHAWVLFLASVALAPMAEELVFRGAILGWLTRLILQGGARRASLSQLTVDQATGVALEVRDEPDPILLFEGSAIDVTVTPAPWSGPSMSDEFAPPNTSLKTPRDLVPEGREPMRAGSESTPPWGLVAGRLLIANVLVSVLFAALHFAVWPTPVPIFFLSLVLGVLYQRTGSLVAPVALHMTFNGVSTVLMFLTMGGMPPAPGLKAQPAPKPNAAPTAPAPGPTVPAPVPIPVNDPAPIAAPR